MQRTTTEARELAWEKLRSWREYRRRVKLELRSRDLDCEKSASAWRSCRSSYAFSDFDSGRLGPALQHAAQLKSFRRLSRPAPGLWSYMIVPFHALQVMALMDVYKYLQDAELYLRGNRRDSLRGGFLLLVAPRLLLRWAAAWWKRGRGASKGDPREPMLSRSPVRQGLYIAA